MDPPRLGEHTEELLRAAGYDDAQIASLVADGVVGTTPQAGDAAGA